MPARALNTLHVAPDALPQIYACVLCWAADLVATLQQKFPVGSPANDKVRNVPAEQAPRGLEASMLLRDHEAASQVIDVASPPWAPASVVAVHLASGLQDAMTVGSTQEFLRTSRLPELSLAVWTAAWEATTAAALGGFLVDDALSPLPASSAARTTKEVLDKLVDGDSVPCGSSRWQSGRDLLCPTMGNFASSPSNIATRATPCKRRRTLCVRRAKTWSIKRRCTMLPGSACSPALTTCKSKSPTWCTP